MDYLELTITALCCTHGGGGRGGSRGGQDAGAGGEFQLQMVEGGYLYIRLQT